MRTEIFILKLENSKSGSNSPRPSFLKVYSDDEEKSDEKNEEKSENNNGKTSRFLKSFIGIESNEIQKNNSSESEESESETINPHQLSQIKFVEKWLLRGNLFYIFHFFFNFFF